MTAPTLRTRRRLHPALLGVALVAAVQIRPDVSCTRAEGAFELKVPINREIGRRFLGAHGMKVVALERRGTVKTVFM